MAKLSMFDRKPNVWTVSDMTVILEEYVYVLGNKLHIHKPS